METKTIEQVVEEHPEYKGWYKHRQLCNIINCHCDLMGPPNCFFGIEKCFRKECGCKKHFANNKSLF